MSALNKRLRGELAENVLSRRNLPVKPDPIELYGKYIKILPLDINRDSEQLFQISNGSPIQRPNKSIEAYDSNELIWKYVSIGPFENLSDFIDYLQRLKDTEDVRFFCIFDAIENYQIGVVAYRNNKPENLAIEIGYIWLSPIAQRTKAATEMCYLLLNNAFNLGYRRVEWLFFSQNSRSYNLAIKVGFVFEFAKKNYCIYKNRQWHLAFLRMLDHEWPERKKQLEKILY